MTLNSSWVPDEDPQILFAEKCWLQGAVVNAGVYGFVVCLCVMSWPLLVRPENPMERFPLLIYIAISFALCTLFVITNTIFTQMAFIDYRNYPGGPNAFENNLFGIPVDSAGTAASVLSNWLSDALVVWRFKVIYQSSRFPIWILMFFPCLTLAASVAMGIMFMIQISTTGLSDKYGVNFTVPYLSISLSLNIIITIAIVLRLLTFKYRIVSALGPNAGGQYTSIISMIIESAALYSIVAIAFLVLLAIGNNVSYVFLQSLTQFQAMATLLIVYRVAQGKGWTKEIATRMLSSQRTSSSENAEEGTMMFAWPSTGDSTQTSSRETVSQGFSWRVLAQRSDRIS